MTNQNKKDILILTQVYGDAVAELVIAKRNKDFKQIPFIKLRLKELLKRQSLLLNDNRINTKIEEIDFILKDIKKNDIVCVKKEYPYEGDNE